MQHKPGRHPRGAPGADAGLDPHPRPGPAQGVPHLPVSATQCGSLMFLKVRDLSFLFEAHVGYWKATSRVEATAALHIHSM